MWRMRRSVRKKIGYAIIGLLCLAGVFFSCYIVMKHSVVTKYERALEEKNRVLSQAEQVVYVTKKEVKAGECFTEENTEQRVVLSEQNPSGIATDIIGMVSCADLPEGMIVTSPLCFEREVLSSERECLFSDIRFTECFADGEVLDVRIRYENGESYCVLKEKRIRKEETEQECCRLFLTEEEQLLISAARYDVQVYEGAELYFVGLVEERLQEKECSEYLPPKQVLLQLKMQNTQYEENFYNWKEQRDALEKRLSDDKQKRRNDVS